MALCFLSFGTFGHGIWKFDVPILGWSFGHVFEAYIYGEATHVTHAALVNCLHFRHSFNVGNHWFLPGLTNLTVTIFHFMLIERIVE